MKEYVLMKEDVKAHLCETRSSGALQGRHEEPWSPGGGKAYQGVGASWNFVGWKPNQLQAH